MAALDNYEHDYCVECAAPLTSLLWGGLCEACFEAEAAALADSPLVP